MVSRTAEPDAETVRLQILGNPHLMREIQQVLRLTSFCLFDTLPYVYLL
jgi:hypothetical protein